ADQSRRHSLLHGVAVGIVHELFPRSKLGTRGFGTQDCFWQVHKGRRPHAFTDFRRGTPRTNGWTACGPIPGAPGRGAQETGGLYKSEPQPIEARDLMFHVWLASDTPGETCGSERDFRFGRER